MDPPDKQHSITGAALRWPGMRLRAGWNGRRKNAFLPPTLCGATAFHAHCPATGRRFTYDPGAMKNSRARQQFGETYVNQKPADPSLNLQFVDEALNLVRDAEAKGIRLLWVRSPIGCNAPTICTSSRIPGAPSPMWISGRRKNRTGQSANFSSRADTFRMKESTWRRRAHVTPICTETPV